MHSIRIEMSDTKKNEYISSSECRFEWQFLDTVHQIQRTFIIVSLWCYVRKSDRKGKRENIHLPVNIWPKYIYTKFFENSFSRKSQRRAKNSRPFPIFSFASNDKNTTQISLLCKFWRRPGSLWQMKKKLTTTNYSTRDVRSERRKKKKQKQQ